MENIRYWVWLSQLNISPKARAAVMRMFESAEAAFHSKEGSFRKKRGISPQEAELLEARSLTGADEVLEHCEEQEISVLPYDAPEFPERLRQIAVPPAVLYVKGVLPPLDLLPVVSVIGTRKASPYGVKMGERLAYEISRCGGTVVSLLTSGVDEAAARGALRADKPCIGVLGTPHELCRLEIGRDILRDGALISEYPPGMAAQRSFFRERNRIAAGISVGVLVVEAPAKSGTRLFAEEAAEQGKELFAVPGCVNDENSAGTLAMLKEGAKLVTCGWDVMSEFQGLYPDKIHPAESTAAPVITPSEEADEPVTGQKAVDKAGGEDYIDLEKQLAGLSEEQLKIIAAIDRNSSHIDDIVEATGLPVGKVLGSLTLLEVKGYIRRDAGKRITLKIAKK